MDRELPPQTLRIRREGNLGEERPSEVHCDEVDIPAAEGVYALRFRGCGAPLRAGLEIRHIGTESMELVWEDAVYTVHPGRSILSETKEYQASYDGPWFVGVDRYQILWAPPGDGRDPAETAAQ